MAEQLLETGAIPVSLWDPAVTLKEGVPAGVLALPAALSNTYESVLDDLGLLERARDIENRQSGRVGGAAVGEGEAHFAENFSGSCGRAQLFCLDPHLTFKTTRDALVSIFSGGKVTVLDIPVGAGAGVITLVSIVAELRREGVLPSIDLEVEVVGGDIDPVSLRIANRMLHRLQPVWLDSGILVTGRFELWDILSDESTSDLLDVWRGTFDGRNGLLLGNNFSGFLGDLVAGQPRIHGAETALRMILSEVSTKRFSALWLEPASNNARRRFIPRMDEIFGIYTRITPTTDARPQSTAEVRDPVVEDGHFTVRTVGAHLTPSS